LCKAGQNYPVKHRYLNFNTLPILTALRIHQLLMLVREFRYHPHLVPDASTDYFTLSSAIQNLFIT